MAVVILDQGAVMKCHSVRFLLLWFRFWGWMIMANEFLESEPREIESGGAN